MVQQIVYTDDKEDKMIEQISKILNISKADAIKKCIPIGYDKIKNNKENGK